MAAAVGWRRVRPAFQLAGLQSMSTWPTWALAVAAIGALIGYILATVAVLLSMAAH
jgi:hypothetical protein